jgi:plasmid maintenance system killer protein
MIVSFRDDWLRDFFLEDLRSKKFRPIWKAVYFADSR